MDSGYKKIKTYPFRYDGNVIWPILFLIIFPPVGIALLLLNMAVRSDDVFYKLHYKGSEGWFIFWSIILFPVAIILAALNGFDIVAENNENEIIVNDAKEQ